MPSDTSASENPTHAMRLIFEYDGDEVRLVSQQPVTMVVADQNLAAPQHPGYYIDTRNAAGTSLARVRATEAFADSVEVFPEPGRAGDTIKRVDMARPRGAFTVVVPMPADADRVAVVRVARPAPPTPSTTPTIRDLDTGIAEPVATDIATFPLQINR